MVLNGVGAIAALALLIRQVVSDDPSELGWNIAFGIFWCGLIGYQVVMLIRRRRADALLELGPDGVRVNDVGRGWVTLPWSAVGSVRQAGLMRGRVTVWPASGVTQSTPGVVFPDPTSFAKAKQQGVTIDTMTSNLRSTEVVEAADRFRHADS
jgi:hypothetical protein